MKETEELSPTKIKKRGLIIRSHSILLIIKAPSRRELKTRETRYELKDEKNENNSCTKN
jgi:hypothetical protein